MRKIRCAVIGVGYLGKYHADKYKQLKSAELLYVCDTDCNVSREIADKLKVNYTSNYHDIIDKIDAVSIATPTSTHHQIAKDFLSKGKHVLIEKPITTYINQAQELVDLAKKNNCILQVGHLERFNAASIALDPYLSLPRFIDSHRLAPFQPRGTDVDVVLDLMIHDIDIIQSILNSEVINIDAQGASVFSSNIDIANARIHFANHCVANVTASRVSFKTERKMRIFQQESYISLDYQQQKIAVFKKSNGNISDVEIVKKNLTKNDSLLLQIESFLNSINNNSKPIVSGEEGLSALITANNITKAINNHWQNILKFS